MNSYQQQQQWQQQQHQQQHQQQQITILIPKKLESRRFESYDSKSRIAILWYWVNTEADVTILSVQVFRPRTPVEAITLVSRLLEYTPGARVTPLEACAHGFFDELREQKTRLPNGRELPPLFNWTQTGLFYLFKSCNFIFLGGEPEGTFKTLSKRS